MKQILVLVFAFAMLFTMSCKDEKAKQSKTKKEDKKEVRRISRPAFDTDSAFFYIKKQVDFGPRVPGTKAHKLAGEWLKTKLSGFVDKVQAQETQTTMYDGTKIPVYNIIGQINPDVKERVLLAAHWDSRHIADKDSDRKNEPIDGANDGASGVGVLLEIARQLKLTNTQLGIDIIFFDAEDLGAPSSYTTTNPHTWCLGAQYWAQNPHIPNYKAEYGILLDMVGNEKAIFKYEAASHQFASSLYNKTWNIGISLGYNYLFKKEIAGELIDDHIYVIKHRQFPMIDIIDYDNQRSTGFGHYHHTHEDNLSNISKNTLKAVGETVLVVLNY